MRVEPYLMFAGRCEEALAFYQRAIGARPQMVMRFKESPEPPPMPLPGGWDDKIMHCGFHVGDTLVMASDGMSAQAQPFNGITLSITADDEAQARRCFAALAEGGSVFMPMGKTFWSPCFGMCSDRFGVSWMVGLDAPPA
ncbi:MAG TPA: VOC family protein [Rubrivivax sp.]|nr:VOC family protein [Rubrivivax sp.]